MENDRKIEKKIWALDPRYVLDRLAVFLNEFIHPDWPWLTKDSILLLEELIKPTDIGLEFGAGRSTVWLSRRMKHLTSLDEKHEWVEKVSAALRQANINDVLLLEKPIEEFPLYAENLTDSYLDFVLVDCESLRHLCVLKVLPKLKPGAILVIDNINWVVPNKSKSPYWRSKETYENETWKKIFEENVVEWRKIWTSNGVTDTIILFKP